jgi:hypothetical protein
MDPREMVANRVPRETLARLVPKAPLVQWDLADLSENVDVMDPLDLLE